MHRRSRRRTAWFVIVTMALGLLLPTVAQGTNAALGLPIPVDPSLRSAVVHLQWAQLDAGSPASVPLTFSDGGTVVVF